VVAIAGCDVDTPGVQTGMGPPINLLVAGTNIEPNHGYTLDQPIRLAFDRFLNPYSVTRQSIGLQDLNGNLVTDPLIAYDPVALSISISNPGQGEAWLTAGQQYQVVLGVPNYEGGGPSGLTAIDGATLAAPITIVFTAAASAEPPFTGVPTMQYCRDIQPIFANSCAYSNCHVKPQPDGLGAYDGGQPPLGLDLSTQAGVRQTALGQVADESNTGPRAVSEPWPTAPFGIDLDVIAPSEPGLSWLMYKTLLAIPVAPDAAIDNSSPGLSTYGNGLTSTISAAERARLSNYILGQSMPYPTPAQAEPSMSTLSEGDLERLSTWIAEGAPSDPSCP
jgi:hypothetical protein